MGQGRSGRGMREVQSGEVDIALVDDWYGRVRESGTMRVFPLLHDPLVLVVPRKHRLAAWTCPWTCASCGTSRGWPPRTASPRGWPWTA